MLAAIAAAAAELTRYPDGNGFALKARARRRGFGVDAGTDRARQRQQRRARARDAGVPAAGRRRRLFAARVRRLPARHAGARRARHRGAGARSTATTSTRCARRSRRARASCSSPIRTIRPAPGIAPVPLSKRSSRRCRGDVLVVLDEAYNEYLEPAEQSRSDRAGSRGIRTSSCRARSRRRTASRRCASATASWTPAVADLMNRVRQPFNVNSLAQAAARRRARRHRLRRREPRAEPRRPARSSTRGLDALGARYVPSHGNFVLIERGRRGRASICALLRQGVIVRPVANYGLPRMAARHGRPAGRKTRASSPRSAGDAPARAGGTARCASISSPSSASG